MLVFKKDTSGGLFPLWLTHFHCSARCGSEGSMKWKADVESSGARPCDFCFSSRKHPVVDDDDDDGIDEWWWMFVQVCQSCRIQFVLTFSLPNLEFLTVVMSVLFQRTSCMVLFSHFMMQGSQPKHRGWTLCLGWLLFWILFFGSLFYLFVWTMNNRILLPGKEVYKNGFTASGGQLYYQ